MAPTLPTPSNPDLQALIEKAKTDLAQRLSIPAAQIGLLQAAEVTWPDASLGCSKAGLASSQVLTPGYLILLEYNQKSYEYHTNKRSYITYCPDPIPPIPSAADK
jgi:hypothetical protein